MFYFVYSKSYHISQNSLIAFVYLEHVQIGVAQHQPAAVHWVGVAQVARAADEQESFSELAEWLRARGAYINKARQWGLLPDGMGFFLKTNVGDGDVLGYLRKNKKLMSIVQMGNMLSL